MFSCWLIWSKWFCLVSIIDSIDDACCENFKERGEENNRPQVPPSKLRPIILFSPLCKILSAWIINKINDTLEAFRFISLWKRFQNSVCFCWCIYCFCHAVAYFRNCSYMVSGAYFIISTGISSHLGLSLGFFLAITLRVSYAVEGIAISVGGITTIVCLFL